MQVGYFFRWWLEQLAPLIPTRLRNRAQGEGATLILESHPDGIHAVTLERGTETRLGTFQPAQSAAENGEPALARLLPDRIRVRVAPGQYLTREVELPLAAEDNLHEAIGYQISQLTPFPADRVFYGCGIERREPIEKRVVAWLAVAPADRIEPALALVGDISSGEYRMSQVRPEPGESLEFEFQTKNQSFGRRFVLPYLPGIGLAILIALVATLHVHNRIETRDHIDAELLEIRKQASVARDLQTTVTNLQQRVDSIESRNRNNILTVRIVDELAKRLDKDTHLKRISLKAKELTLSGTSKAAAELISILDASPLLTDVRFQSSVVRDRRNLTDRFSIVATVVQGTDNAPPTGENS